MQPGRTCLVTVFAACLVLVTGTAAATAEERVEIANSKDLLALFDKLGYTPQAWQAGIREVPRVYLAEIPSRWREKGSKELPVVDKKRIFFRVLAPIVLRINELILEDRTRAESIARSLASGKEVPQADQQWLRELANRYGVIASPDDPLDASRIEELLRRVDIIPPSLALAQSASESGWGTSRFADEGNALFGQWSWSEGIKPSDQRKGEHGDHRVAAFASTGQSVLAYANNLNTHRAYEEFRRKRAGLREQGLPVRGKDLVGTLIHYSERGQAYVDDLVTIMRQNRLDPADDAYLRKMDVIRLVPKGSPGS